jgi:hypothetical protein
MSSNYVVLLYTPQRMKARGLTLIGILIRLANGEGRGPYFFVMEACKGVQHRLLLEQGMLSFSLQANVYSSC